MIKKNQKKAQVSADKFLNNPQASLRIGFVLFTKSTKTGLDVERKRKMQKKQVSMDPQTQANIDTWLKGNYEEKSKQEILRLQRENPEALIDAFYTRLAFGTGGLRGIMGVGSNRMNEDMVRMATQGLANYLKKAPKIIKSLLF